VYFYNFHKLTCLSSSQIWTGKNLIIVISHYSMGFTSLLNRVHCVSTCSAWAICVP